MKHFYPLLPQKQYHTGGCIRISLSSVRLDIEKLCILILYVSLINEIDEEFLVPQSRGGLTRNFKN